MVRETSEYFSKMSETIDQQLQTTWLRNIESAEKHRKVDLSGMDILGARDTRPSQPAIPVINTALRQDKEWLELALSIEEKQ